MSLPAAPGPVPLAAVDAAWWRMERPTNRMVITAVLLFDEPFTRDDTVRLLEERLAPQPRFRRRIEERGRLHRPRWVPVDVDVRDHLVVERWPGAGDEPALERRVAAMLAEPLDVDRPLWRVHLLEGGANGRSALVVRVHHCVADGVALVGVLLALTDEHSEIEVPLVGQDEDARATTMRGAARRVIDDGLTLLRLALLRPDPTSGLKGKVTVEKRAAWTDAVPLDDVKHAAKATGAHVSDVLLANAAAALAAARAHHRARALVPLFLRPRGADDDSNNHFGLVFVPLPVQELSPTARVRAVHDAMTRAKVGADARVALEVLGAFGRVSKRLENLGVAFFTAKATAMITSVPGPTTTVHLLGHPVEDIIAFGPASGSVALTAGLFSYRGRVRVSFAVDAGLVDDARTLVDAWKRAQDELTASSGVRSSGS